MLGIARIEKSSIEWGGKDRFGNGRISRRKGGPTLKQRGTTILDWPPSHGLERKRSPCYYKASKLLPQDTVALPMGTG
ncbi:hypothetical protein QYF36_004075 [Acer negundo]|nr:hypothetical protein QYF36_004075 [Acer negundo]